MLVLGIDPGCAICGSAVFEQLGYKIHAVQYGAVLTDKDEKPELRLKKIYEEISALIDHYKPDLMSIEKLFFNRNVTTAIPVGQARGVVLLAAANQSIPVLEFTPMQIKISVVGTGSATKEQVTYMVQHLLNIKNKPKPDDVADALAAAICGINTASTLRWIKK
ncbi:MAG: crossover junction endodeoxyribonuclease RuvC [Acidaminococcaceae bacterium]|nr:crossover junction endodeoxyribonuclease RuvC [Acidaminococcaceae bacterium]